MNDWRSDRGLLEAKVGPELEGAGVGRAGTDRRQFRSHGAQRRADARPVLRSLVQTLPTGDSYPGFTGFYLVLLGFTGFYLVLLGFTGFYLVLLGFTGFYLVLLGFTGFYLVLLGFTGFYRVLPGFT